MTGRSQVLEPPHRQSLWAALLCCGLLAGALLGVGKAPAVADGPQLVPTLLKDISPGSTEDPFNPGVFTPNGSNPTWFVELGGTTYFPAADFSTDQIGQSGLWKTDGTPAGTSRVKALIPAAAPARAVLMGGNIYFAAADASDPNVDLELWKSDGTADGTVLVKNTEPTFSGSPANFTVAGTTLFFTSTTADNGKELWKSDGTTDGTRMVKDINVGAAGSNPTSLTALGSSVVFAATNGTATGGNGVELWISDGTTAGTVLLRDINSGTANSNPASFAVLGNQVLFTATNGQTAGLNGQEVWKTDGTTTGTVLVKDIRPGLNTSQPGDLTSVGSFVLFHANDGTNGPELWRSDGTTLGTVLVKDIRPGSAGSSPGANGGFGIMNGVAYFPASDSATGTLSSGPELWKSDGTGPGTVLVKDINPGVQPGSSPGGIGSGKWAVIGTDIYFGANTATSGRELWKSNGTEAGTVMVADIKPGAEGSGPDVLTPILGSLFFSADDGTTGVEPWVLGPAVTTTTTTVPATTTTTVAPDTTPPTCAVTAVRAGPPKQLDLTAQDTGSGLASITVVSVSNGTVNVPPFTPGTTSPVVVTATKTNQSSPTVFNVDVTDVAGNTTHCR